MKKLTIFILFILAMSVVKADVINNGKAPYYVESSDKGLMKSFEVRHNFKSRFSAMLSDDDVSKLKNKGVKVEAIGIFTINGKPFCGDGKCKGLENPSNCPADCSGDDPTPDPDPEPDTRVCTPADQTPWGIETIYNEQSILYAYGGNGVMVAVLDTGLDQDHPDLVNRIVGCVTKVTHSKSDSRSCEDGNGHGTHVAGTILADAGSDDDGIFGVAPQADLMAVKVLNRKGIGYGDDISAGIYYAVDNGADIISMSLGSDYPDPQIRDAVDYASNNGVLIIAAAGNDGPLEGSIDYPAAFASVVAVAAVNSDDFVPSWSSVGVNDDDGVIEEGEIELTAPGVDILSTWKGGCYKTMMGTSMATPHIAGLAAKYWTSRDVTRNYLQSIAIDMGDDKKTGFGMPVVQ